MLYQSAYEAPQDYTADVMTLGAARAEGGRAGAGNEWDGDA